MLSKRGIKRQRSEGLSELAATVSTKEKAPGTLPNEPPTRLLFIHD